MSEQNVAVVRRIYEAVTQRDVVTPFELYAEDIVWDISRSSRGTMIGEPIAQGHQAVRQAWTDLVSAFGDVDFDLADLIDAGDKVFACVHDRAVGRTSGAPVQSVHYAVWTVADGKVKRLEVFDDRQEAQRAAGLGR